MIKELINEISIRIAILFSIIAYIISLFTSIIFGSTIFMILVKPLISAFVVGIVAFALYKLIKAFVPEFTDVVEHSSSPQRPTSEEEQMYDDILGDDLYSNQQNEVEGDEDNENQLENGSFNEEQSSDKKKKPKPRSSGNNIIVEGVPLEKDPDLMAKAVKHILDTDET